MRLHLRICKSRLRSEELELSHHAARVFISRWSSLDSTPMHKSGATRYAWRIAVLSTTTCAPKDLLTWLGEYDITIPSPRARTRRRAEARLCIGSGGDQALFTLRSLG
jgi:hypothetical protein